MTASNSANALPLQPQKAQYMVQLDALRALAVFSVLVHHYLPQSFILNSVFHIGPLGVRLFFVLSGFLITGILLRCRESLRAKKLSLWSTVQRFYLRRFLRLLPIYYLTILATVIIAFSIIKPGLIWHLTYTSNIYFSLYHWDAVSSHFWSLSVEEQFYLVWPWVILLTPQSQLLNVILLTTAIGPGFRALCFMVGWANDSIEFVFTFACLDALGAGSVLAFYTHYSHQYDKKLLCRIAYWMGVPLFVTLNFIHLPLISNAVLAVVTFSVDSLVFLWLIDRAAKGFGGMVGQFLELPPLVYLGKISYGIYMFHLIIPTALYKVTSRLGLPYPDSIWLRFLLNVGVTLAVAIVSWTVIEQPINRLKHKYDYQGVS